MSRIVKSLIRSRLQQWPYEELKDNSNEQLFEFYGKVAWIGTEHRYQNILAHDRNVTYSQIGTGVIAIIFGYIVGWMAIILCAVYVIYQINHHTGGH